MTACTFKAAQDSSRTFCIKVDKQLVQVNGETTPGGNWQIFVTDSIGSTNAYSTNELGTTDAQICGLTAGSYTVAEQMPNGYTQIAMYLNGQQIDSTSALVTLGSGNVIGCRILRMSRASLYERIRDGEIKAQKDGRRRYITTAELQRYIASKD